MARGPSGDLFLADQGTLIGPLLVTPNVWRVSPAGEYDYDGTPATVPIDVTVPPGESWNPILPVALAVDSVAQPSATTPWTLYVLDQAGSGPAVGLYALTAPGPAARTFTVAASVKLNQLGPAGNPVYQPVAMALVPGTKTLVVVDGGRTPAGGVHPPKLVLLDVSGVSNTLPTPPTVLTTRPLTGVVTTPLSAVALSNGDVIVGDGGDRVRRRPREDLAGAAGATGRRATRARRCACGSACQRKSARRTDGDAP